MCGSGGRNLDVAAGSNSVQRGQRLGSGRAHNPVGGIDVDDDGRVGGHLVIVVVGVADENHLVTGGNQASRGSIEAHITSASLSLDHVGLEPGSVGDINYRHLFELDQVGGIHQVPVDRHRADVMQVRVGHGGTVDLRLHHPAMHGFIVPVQTRPASIPHSECEVVEQAGRAESGGYQETLFAGDACDSGGRIECGPIDQGRVVKVRLRLSLNGGAQGR